MIIVVGASSSIGSRITPSLLTIDEVIGTASSEEKLSSLGINDKRFSSQKVDLNDRESIDSFCAFLKGLQGNITLLNLAAIAIDKLFISYSQQEWNSVINLNLNSSIQIMQSVIPAMMKARWGRIITVSSVTASRTPVGTAAYAASKAAVTSTTKTIAHEYARFGITANTMTLGYFDAGLTLEIPEAKQNVILKNIPSGKFGSCEDIVNCVKFIMETDYLNGSEVTLDGGML
jgi:3-oxoacyl-[acyl-carrier protein] reductase